MDKNKQSKNKNKKTGMAPVFKASFPGSWVCAGFVSPPARGGLQRK